MNSFWKLKQEAWDVTQGTKDKFKVLNRELEGLSSYLLTWEKLQKKHIWRQIYEFDFGHAVSDVYFQVELLNIQLDIWVWDSLWFGGNTMQITYVIFNFLVTTF